MRAVTQMGELLGATVCVFLALVWFVAEIRAEQRKARAAWNRKEGA